MASETLMARSLDIPHRAMLGMACDHAGFPLKAFIGNVLKEHCDELVSLGATSEEPVDFPDVTREAVDLIRSGQVERVVLVCGTGAGACIAANKIAGIRAAVAHDTYVARQCVEHDNVNVLCIGAWIIGPQIAADVTRAFLAGRFSSEQHFQRRVEKLAALEREFSGKAG